MVRFSDQIRQAVRDCGSSRYVLAKQLGISESTISRFMAGNRGLTLDLLDKLADVLGLQVVFTVQRVQRPARRGRKKKEKEMMTVKSKEDWRLVAKAFAKDANENHFSSRRGVWFLENAGVLCVYNNNPYVGDPSQ